MPLKDIIPYNTPSTQEYVQARYNALFPGASAYNGIPNGTGALESALQNSASKVTGPSLFEGNQLEVMSFPKGHMANRLPEYIPGVDMEDFYANNQSVGTSIFNGILGGVEKIGTKTLTGLGYLAGLAGLDNRYEQNDGSWIAGAGDNALAKFGTSLEETINNEWRPVYQEAADRNKGFFTRAFTDLNFWTQDATDALAFMASAWVPGMALSKIGLGAKLVRGAAALRGIGLAEDAISAGGEALSGASRVASSAQELNKLGQLYKWVSNAKLARNTDVAVTSMINTASEAMFEAQSTKEEVLRTINADPVLSKLSEEEKIHRAAEAAQGVFRGNMAALAFSNLFEANLMFKKLPGSSAASDLAERATKNGIFGGVDFAKKGLAPKLWDITKNFGKGVGVEGFYEENIQLAIQRINQQRAIDNTSKTPGVLEQMKNQTLAALQGNDPEAATSIGLGGIIGGGEVLISSALDARGQKARTNKMKEYLNGKVDAFKGLGDIYEREDVVTTDAEGKEVKTSKLVLDSNGKPKIDADKLAAFQKSQGDILEYMDLAQLADDNGKQDLKAIYEGELFGKMAEAHFELGLGDVLMDKLNDLNSLTPEDLSIMGFSPESKEQAAQKIEQFKARAQKLQQVWDGINDNVLRGSNETEANHNLRKSELFRLWNRKLSIQELSDAENANYAKLQSDYAALTGKAGSSVVEGLNIRQARLFAAEKYMDELEKTAEVHGDTTDWEVEAARDRVKKATEDLRTFNEENAEEISKLERDEDGFYKQQDGMFQEKALKRSAIKRAELELSQNSVDNRIERLQDIRSGSKYFDVNEKQIRDTQNPIPVTQRLNLKGKKVEDYLTYENRSLRRQRIKTKLGELNDEYAAKDFAKKIDDMDLTNSDKAITDILDGTGTLPQDVLDKFKGHINNLADTRLKELEQEEAAVQDKFDNAPTTWDENLQDDVNDPADMAEYEASMKRIANERQAIEDVIRKADQIKPSSKEETTDNKTRREIAEDYFVDADEIISSIKQTEEGFDTPEDLERVQKQIDQLEKLQEFIRERTDEVQKSKEFEGFDENIQEKIDALKEIAKTIEARIADRKLMDIKIRQNNIRNTALGLGVVSDNNTRTAIFPAVEKLASKSKEVWDRIMKGLNETNPSEEPNVYTGHLNALADVLRVEYQRATEEERKEFNEAIAKEQERLMGEVLDSTFFKFSTSIEAFPKRERLEELYETNPTTTFINMVGTLKNKTTDKDYDDTEASPVRKFEQDRDLRLFLERTKKDDKRTPDNSYATSEEVAKTLENHLQFVHQQNMMEFLLGNVSVLVQVENEIAVMEEGQKNTKEGIYAPSSQQLQALREIVRFFFTNKESDQLFSAFAYLKGAAGTGKSTVLGKWLPKLLRIPQEEIFATGTDASSSATINKIIGNDEAPSIEDLISALKSGKKLRLVLLDEVGKLGKEQLIELSAAVEAYNLSKKPEERVKIILLGDPNQMNINSAGKLVETPAIEQYIFTKDPKYNAKGELVDYGNAITNIHVITPLTIRYRSNVAQVSGFADKFINQSKDITAEEVITKSNNPTLDGQEIAKGELLGVKGSQAQFKDDLDKIVTNTNFDDGKTRAIITNPEDVDDYKKYLESKGVTSDQVEVLSYINAQGRTIDEVYIDVKKKGEVADNLNLYNKALYVATSRATSFILMGNMNARNEKDSEIGEDKKKNTKDVNEAPAAFIKDRKEELKTEKDDLKENMEKDVRESSAVLSPKEIKKEKKEEEKAEKEEEKEKEAEMPNPEEQPEVADEDVDEETPEGETPTERTLESITVTPYDKLKQFLHNVLFPSFGATKNLTARGDISDKALARKRKEGVEIDVMSPSVKADDTVYYIPTQDSNKNPIVVLVTPYKDGKGNIVKEKYRQVGVLSEKDMEELEKNPHTQPLYKAIKDWMEDPARKVVSKAGVSTKVYNKLKNVEKLALAVGQIAHINHLTFHYDNKNPKDFDLNTIVKTFIQGFFGKEHADNQALINKIQNTAKIVIYTKKQLEEDSSIPEDIRAGIPYLVLTDLVSPGSKTSSGKPKPMFIALDRKVLNKETHKDFIQPVLDAISLMKEVEQLLPKALGYKHAFYLDLLRKISNHPVGTFYVETFSEDSFKNKVDINDEKRGIPLEITPELVQKSKELLDLYEKESKDFFKGTLVHHNDPEIDKTFLGKRGDKLTASGAVITETKEEEDPNTLEKKVFVKLRYFKKEGDVIAQVEDDKWYSTEDLRIARKKTGDAQHAINVIWTGNLANVKKSLKNDDKFPQGSAKIDTADEESLTDEELQDIDNIGRIDRGPSLLNSKLIFDIGFWEDFFKFDKEGNHAPKDKGTPAFRMPIPRTAPKNLGGFTSKGKNILEEGDQKRLDYYIQSSFIGVAPTAISVVFNKDGASPTEPEPTTKTPYSQVFNVTEGKNKGKTLVFNIDESKLEDVIVPIDGKKLFIGMHGRFFVLAKVGNTTIPFYISSEGTSGKEKGKWYPFFGNASNGWLIKGTLEQMENNYGSSEIAAVQDALNKHMMVPTGFIGLDGTLRGEDNKVIVDINNHVSFGSYSLGEKWTENDKERNAKFGISVDPKLNGHTSPLIDDHIKGIVNAILDKSSTTTTSTAEEETATTSTEPDSIDSIISGLDEDDLDDEDDRISRGGRKASTDKYAGDELGKALTEQEVFKEVRGFFPTMSEEELRSRVRFVSDAQMMKLTMGEDAWGIFKDNIIYLRKNPDNTVYSKVVKHEVFHMIFNNYLTTQERAKFIQAMKDADPRLNYMTPEQLDEYVDEWGADHFMQTPKELKNVNYYIKLIMKKIMEFFNFVSPNIENLDELFKAINNGTIGSRYSSLNEQVKSFITKGLETGLITTNCK